MTTPVTPPAPDNPAEIVVVVFVADRPENYLPTLNSLADAVDYPVVLATPDPGLLGPLASLGLPHLRAQSPAEAVNLTWESGRSNILMICDAVVVPAGFLDNALSALHSDLRVATVSFLSNAGNFLSFPFRNTPRERVVDGRDELNLTRTLRSTAPAATPAPVPFAVGAAVVISSAGLSAIGPLAPSPSGLWSGSLADFSLRGRTRGFVDLADCATFYARPSDLSSATLPDLLQTGLDPADIEWCRQAHPFISTLLGDQSRSTESPLALEYGCARTKVMGLRVAVDATCLGPSEMGTQVATLAVIEALAEQEEVAQLAVLVRSQLTPHAMRSLTHPKIRVEYSEAADPAVLGPADVAYRPFQPDVYFDIDQWRAVADRVAVSVLDLISYQIGHYHGTDSAWLDHRRTIASTLAKADGIIAISQDVAGQIALERMPVDPSRLFVVHPGTNHLFGDEKATIPEELLARGFAGGEFVLTLGTTYTHKNRDIAIRAHEHLVRRGINIPLVLAGPSAPFGSSRARESLQWRSQSEVFVLPGVSSEERNWLLRHASVVLYPTSAEGFGFVAHEAARFGTPTTYVSFGPLREMGGEPPVTAVDWDPASIADAAEQLLRDPALTERQVKAALAAGESYTWESAASKLIGIYRTLLVRPAVRPSVPD